MSTIVDIPSTVPIAVFRTLVDYPAGTLVYMGQNAMTALIADTTWRIQKFFYNGSGDLVDAQVMEGAWTNRASLAWKPASGD